MPLSNTIINNNYCKEPYCQYPYCGPTDLASLQVEVNFLQPGRYVTFVQVIHAIYNTTNLRILWELASDGTSGNNYTASSNASTDKNVNNLRTDTIEQYWQSTAAVAEWIQFDAGAGKEISMDTFALLQHNLTSSAVVNIYGYGTGSDAAPVSWIGVPLYTTAPMSSDPDETNLIWIAPTLPRNTFRHWRITIQDPTNSNGFLRIGRLVAGSALIFTAENCLDNVTFKQENFKDELKLNGFQSIANNRALKKQMTIQFKDLDRIAELNYRRVRRYYRYCRDTLKALVIVDPQNPYQFTVYSKLTGMPAESHRFVSSTNSYTTMTFNYDEGR